MIPFLFLLILSPESDTAQSRLDSLQVYNTYKSSIDILKNSTEPSDWYAVEDSLGRVAACALLRLSRFNKQSYEPSEEYNREGMGVAFGYPKPSDAWIADFRAKRQADTKKQTPEEPAKAVIEKKTVAPEQTTELAIAFTVLNSQTHFLVSNNGKTKTPYVEKYYYAKGRVLLKTEKLSPTTLKPIILPQSETAQPAFTVSTE